MGSFTNFVAEEHREHVTIFYFDLIDVQNDFPTIEFPIIKKDGSQIWGSQKVITQRDSNGAVIGYSGIIRDITLFKNLEDTEKTRLEKIEQFNKTINYLSNANFSLFDNFDEILNTILKSTAIATKTDSLTYWNYQNGQSNSKTTYTLETAEIEDKKLNPTELNSIDFELLKEQKVIIIPDIKNVEEDFLYRKSLIDDQYNSILAMSVFHNNSLIGVLCFANRETNRLWDNEDTNFIRTIINIISLSIELQLRLDIQKQLKYKSEVLSLVSQSTEKFLLFNKPLDHLSEIFATIGKATNVDHIYYYENDLQTQIINQKVKWAKENIPLQITPLKSFTHQEFSEILIKASSKNPFIAIVSNLKQSFFKNLLVANEIRSIIIWPIYFYNEFSGFIGFDSCTEDRTWTLDEISIFQILSSTISSVIQRSTNQRLKEESEERFRLLANNIPGAVYLSKFDVQWTKIYLNDQILELTGYEKNEFLSGQLNFSDLIHDDDKHEVLKASTAKISNGEKLHLTYRIRTKDNTIKWIEEFADIIKTEDVIEYVEGIFIDITERKKTESAIIDKELAQSANKAKSEFLANMSHEIKTPLNGIIGFTDLLIKSKLNAEQESYMTTVNHSANVLLGIINDILDFSKIEAGKLELELQSVLLKDIIESVSQVVRYDLEQKNLKLNVILDEEIPQILCVDPVRLKQVMLNLISNAIKFTEEGQITIQLQYTKVVDPLSFKIRFSIIDTGIGIAPENQKKIFEPFLQGDNSTTRKFGGTGLGLAISNQLLKLMESKLKIKSQLHEGSTFYFDLVMKHGDTSIEETTQTNFTDLDLDEKSLNFKILIAEDNAINMLLIKTILKSLFPKAQLLESVNGEDAVSKYLALNPDLILMDIQMPLLNGLEATQRIRELKPEHSTPIIALTAATSKEERDLCLASGMNDFITKPIVKETIKELILKWIQPQLN